MRQKFHSKSSSSLTAALGLVLLLGASCSDSNTDVAPQKAEPQEPIDATEVPEDEGVADVTASELEVLQNAADEPIDAPSLEAFKLVVSESVPSTYRNALPLVSHPRIQQIFADPDTIWYDKTTMLPSYQDSVGDARRTPVGVRANYRGGEIIVPEGKKFFNKDGTWSFPFAHTAGTDKSDNLVVVNFLSLPKQDGKRLPVVYYVERSTRNTIPVSRWKWLFPKGTMFGELLLLRDTTNQLYPLELRTRERFASNWATNVFRPFPTAKHLSKQIKSFKPDWENSANLRQLLAHLDNNATLQPLSLTSTAFPGTFSHSGFVDSLPPIGDKNLVINLLTKTPFIASYGLAWKADGERKAFAPTTTEAFSVVPRNYEAGILEVTDESCHRCHSQGGRALSDFERATILYGDIWGVNQIFSWHPFDEAPYRDGSFTIADNRKVRPEYVAQGLVTLYNPNSHPSSLYPPIPEL